MRNELTLLFRDSYESIFSGLKDRYGFTMKMDEENLITLDGLYCQIVIGVFDSHQLNLTTKIRYKDDPRFLGLGLIASYLNINIDLGCEDIKTSEEMLSTMKKHSQAIPILCNGVIIGNGKEWEAMKSYADQK